MAAFCLFCGDPLVPGHNDSKVNGTGMDVCIGCRKSKLGINTNKEMADFMLSQNPSLNKDEIYKKMNIREGTPSSIDPVGVANKYTRTPGTKTRKSALDKEMFSMGKLMNECLYSSSKNKKKHKLK